MNACAFTGKIYNLKDNGKSGKDANVRFSLGVRKSFVSDSDKKAGKTLAFVPCNIWGDRAEWITKYFKDGDFIDVVTEWDPFEGKDGNVPQFRVIKADFTGGAASSNSGDSNNSSDRNERRGSSRDDRDDRDDRGSRRDSSSRRSNSDEGETPSRSRRRTPADEGDDGVPF